jgi:hypothetical protein
VKKKSVFSYTATTLLTALAAVAQPAGAQPTTKARSTIAQSLTAPALPLSRVQDGVIPFPLPKDSQAYSSIDGKKMHKYVVELAQISRRYRDAGHPKFWGRIMGTPSDVETNEWLAAKFKSIGLMDVRTQPIDLPPQWMPKNWDVTMTTGGQTIHVDSAQPDYGDDGLPAGGIEVDAVYAGLVPKQISRARMSGARPCLSTACWGWKTNMASDARAKRAPPSFLKFRCCLETCVTRPIHRAPRFHPLPLAMMTGLRFAR